MDRVETDRWKPKEVARLLALVETERRYYQDIIAHLPVGLVVVSPELAVVSANRSFRQSFALKSEEIGTVYLNNVLRVDDLNDRIAEVLTTGTSQHNILYSPPGEDMPRFFRVSILALRNWEDEIEIEALLVFDDVTGLDGAPSRTTPLSDAKPILMPMPVDSVKPTELLENIDAMVWECDAELRLTDLSAYAETMLGHAPAHWLKDGAPWDERVHPDDRAFVSKLYRDAIENRTRLHLEYRCRTADNRTLWVRESIRVQRDAAGRAKRIWGVTIDINENRRLAERMLLNHKMDSLSRLTTRVAHQYNNFLMVISSYGEDLKEMLTPEHPLRADVDEILNAAAKVSELTAKLLAFGRRPMARAEKTEFATLVSNGLQPVMGKCPAETELVRVLPPELGQLDADPKQIQRAITDLVGAAVKQNGKGRVTVESARIDPMESANAEPMAGTLCLSVVAPNWQTDTEARRRMFEPSFLQNEAAYDLSDAYWFVRQNHGEILVTGESGLGTTITLLFPLAAGVQRLAPVPVIPAPAKVIPLPVEDKKAEEKKAEEPAPAPETDAAPAPVAPAAPIAMPSPVPPPPQALATPPAEPVSAPEPPAPVTPTSTPAPVAPQVPPPSAAVVPPEVIPQEPPPAPSVAPEPIPPTPAAPQPARARTVLVVEDEEGVRSLVRKILLRNGYEVLDVATSGEALEMVTRHPGQIDLLVTDVVMEGMSGTELANKLRNEIPTLKVVFASGYAGDAMIQSGSLPPGTAFLQKPFTLGSLLEKVQEVSGTSREK